MTMKTMKTILATITIGVSALISTVDAYAGDGMEITPITSEKKARVELKNPKSIDVSVFVTNEEGKVVHEETLQSQRSYGRMYDFTNLKDGKYTIISDDDYITTTTEVKVGRSNVEVLNNEFEYKPIFSTKESSIMVNYLNINAEDIKFSIEGEQGILYESAEGSDISFQKKMSISKMHPGDYYANIEVGSKTYSYYFYVR